MKIKKPETILQWSANIDPKSSLSEDKNLFVPMHMDILVVGKESTHEWKPIVMEYGNLTNYKDYRGLGKFIATPADENPDREKKLGSGVHLHWVLPKAFRHGKQLKNEGSPNFPLIPNRWLIIRTIVSDTVGLIQKSWIVESDTETIKGKEKNWVEFIQTDPSQNLVPGKDALKTKNIGKVTEFNKDTWTDDTSKELFLNIQAPGNPSFAASYNASKNILGFHDEMKDANPGKYAYLVCGWYANPNQDLFNKSNQVLDTSKSNNTDVLKDVDLWINKMKELNWKLEALEEKYNQLKKYEPASGLLALTEEIHTQRFHPFDGGSIWVIEKKEKSNLTDKTLNEVSLDPFPDNISKMLKTINENQEEYDRGLDELAAIQNQTYADWFKKEMMYASDLVQMNDAEYDREITKLEGSLKTNLNRINLPG